MIFHLDTSLLLAASALSCVFGLLGVILSLVALLKAMSAEKATHTVQFMSPDMQPKQIDPFAEEEHVPNPIPEMPKKDVPLDEDWAKKIDEANKYIREDFEEEYFV